MTIDQASYAHFILNASQKKISVQTIVCDGWKRNSKEKCMLLRIKINAFERKVQSTQTWLKAFRKALKGLPATLSQVLLSHLCQTINRKHLRRNLCIRGIWFSLRL